jgi:hypothetical protein
MFPFERFPTEYTLCTLPPPYKLFSEYRYIPDEITYQTVIEHNDPSSFQVFYETG